MIIDRDENPFIGAKVDKTFEYKDITMLFLCGYEQSSLTPKQFQSFDRHPAFWLSHKDILYFAICSLKFLPLETYYDWSHKGDYIDIINPRKFDFDSMASREITYYEVIYDNAFKDLDNFCEIEVDILKKFRRNLQFKTLFND